MLARQDDEHATDVLVARASRADVNFLCTGPPSSCSALAISKYCFDKNLRRRSRPPTIQCETGTQTFEPCGTCTGDAPTCSQHLTAKSGDNSPYVVVLKNGDDVPSIPAFQDQANLAVFVDPFVNVAPGGSELATADLAAAGRGPPSTRDQR